MTSSIKTEEQLIQVCQTWPVFSDLHANAAHARQNELTKPQGSLGRLEDIAVWMCGWQATDRPRSEKVLTLLFAGNHGVAARGVSAFPPAVTHQMVLNFERGGAAVNQLCNAIGSELRVYPLSLDTPTQDFTQGPAMTAEETFDAFNAGFMAVSAADVLVLGEMGIGNTTPSAALACVIAGGTARDWVGRGTGVDDAGIQLKQSVVQAGIDLHKTQSTSTLELLRRLGGREHAAIAGAIVRARLMRIPVILDGYVVTSAAATLTLSHPQALGHCVAGHVSAESAHGKLLNQLKLVPLLDLGMRLGEASGALVAVPVLRAATATHNGMATFASANVSA